MTIQERMQRDDNDDKIYIGQLVEEMFRGEHGVVFKAFVTAIKEDTTKVSQDERSKLPADRYLGRLEGLDMLTDYIVKAVTNMRSLKAEIKESQRV